MCGWGQRREDIRVSPIDVSTSRVPEQGRFQSAAAIKGTTLVAWGTSRLLPDDSIAFPIRYQLFNGSFPATTDRPLTTDPARPFGYTIVMPVENAFLVLWNDNRKDSGGIYMQRVAGNGNFLGGEIRIGKGTIIPDSSVGIWGLPNRTGGSLLIWRDGSDTNLHGIRVDRDGQPNENEQIIAKNMDRILTFDSLPGTYMLMNGRNGVLVDDRGDVDLRTTRIENPSAFYFGGDTSLTVIQGDTLRYYHSIFDPIPYRTLTVPAIDSGVPGMTAVQKKSDGTIQVFFGRVSVTGTQMSLGQVVVRFYRVDIFPNDSISAPVSVIDDRWKNGSTIYSLESYSISAFQRASGREGSSGTHLFKLDWTAVGYIHDHPQPESQFATYYSIGRNGAITTSDSAFISNGYTAQQNGSIKRIDDTTASSVSITIAKKNIVLHATSALLTNAVARTNPGLLVSNNALIATWEEPGRSFDCRRWLPATGTPAQRISRVHLPDIQEPNIFQMQSIRKTLSHEDYLYNRPGMSGIMSEQRIEDYGVYYYTTASYGYEQLSWGMVSFLMATDTGWNTPISLSDTTIYPPLAASHSIQEAFCGYDPNSNEVCMRVWRSVADRSSPLTILSAGPNSNNWHVDNLDTMLKYGPAPVQTDYRRFMIYGDTAGRIYDGNSLFDQISFSTIRPSFCFRALGSHFIRLFWLDSISTDLQIELYDFDHTLLASRAISRAQRNQFPLFIQNPRDFSWALYWSAQDGVHITLLGNDLRVIIPDTLISAGGLKTGVSAVFRGDTLFAVWEDHRNGKADIYGNYLPFPRRSASVNDQSFPGSGISGDSSRNISFSMYPNPARAIINIDMIASMSDDADIAIVNTLGQVIRSVHREAEPGTRHRFTIATGDIPAGAYFLHYHIGLVSGAIPLQIRP
ncbi:MAG: hypothetical protein JWQ98_1830 [Chlorobi bacterium]|nr:hypothetical protein [Chlorobiota bacterium]